MKGTKLYMMERVKISVRFSEVSDPQPALELSSKIKQKPGENIPIFAERLHILAKEVFKNQNANLPIIQKQLVNFLLMVFLWTFGSNPRYV